MVAGSARRDALLCNSLTLIRVLIRDQPVFTSHRYFTTECPFFVHKSTQVPLSNPPRIHYNAAATSERLKKTAPDGSFPVKWFLIYVSDRNLVLSEMTGVFFFSRRGYNNPPWLLLLLLGGGSIRRLCRHLLTKPALVPTPASVFFSIVGGGVGCGGEGI